MAELTEAKIEELRGLLAQANDAATRMAQNKSSLTDLITFRSIVNALPALLDAAERASRAREDALREAAEVASDNAAGWRQIRDEKKPGHPPWNYYNDICKMSDALAAAIHALIDKPKGGDANDKSKVRTRDHATSPGVITGASGEAKQVDPDWFWCDIDPDESGDSAYQAMFTYRPRLEPVELCTSYVGPRLWGVMSPPLPDADNDEETAHTFDTREAAQAFCDERNAIFNGAALCPSEGGDRG